MILSHGLFVDITKLYQRRRREVSKDGGRKEDEDMRKKDRGEDIVQERKGGRMDGKVKRGE